MRVFTRLSCIVLFLLVLPLSSNADDSYNLKAGSFALGYNQGLMLKVHFAERVYARLSGSYNLETADLPEDQPVQNISGTLGLGVTVLKFNRLAVNAFLDGSVLLRQDVSAIAYEGGATNEDDIRYRYNQYLGSVRIGLEPEVFLSDRFSLGFGMGLRYTYVGDTYRLSSDESGVVSNKDEHHGFDIIGMGGSFLNDWTHSITMTIYIL